MGRDTIYPDDFLESYPGASKGTGGIQRVDPVQPFAKLSNGRTKGVKSTAVLVTGAGGLQPSPVDLLNIGGQDDENACQLNLCLLPPEVIPGTPAIPVPANLSGEVDNAGLTGAVNRFNPCFARIKWGVGGALAVAEVDFSNGANVNLVASFVRVSAFWEGFGAAFNVYRVSAFIGPGQPRPVNAQRTLFVAPSGLAAGAVTAIFPVPRFAKGFYPNWVQNAGVDDIRVDFFSDPAAAFNCARYDFSKAGGVVSPAFPRVNQVSVIPNSAMYVRATNLSASALDVLSLIFELNI